ncbi:MAG: hypothetical protein QOF20_3427 [Acidimicrobiaceae bacterium]|jgi:hypothetical protein|nr:hypothetical protein [Acidimicrobiaceae bacterium]MDQ1371074.1 hypothetical protein [Acidimicrobiaceae bacterium]MDQ1400952.1 hypothetical protein [Acidimicrobiaceae bacterium]MDQ1420737.1 hypothetical protein [Acidimicrobiaceae bacterium]
MPGGGVGGVAIEAAQPLTHATEKEGDVDKVGVFAAGRLWARAGVASRTRAVIAAAAALIIRVRIVFS